MPLVLCFILIWKCSFQLLQNKNTLNHNGDIFTVKV